MECQAGPPVTHTDVLIPCRGGGKSPSLSTWDSQTSRTVSLSQGRPVEPGSGAGMGAWGCTRRVGMPQKLDTQTLLNLLSLQTRPPPTPRETTQTFRFPPEIISQAPSPLSPMRPLCLSPAQPSLSGLHPEERDPD